MSAFLVLLTGAVIVLSALVTVTRRNPIHAALSMLIALGGVGLLMLALRSPFLAAMQVLLYAGAIMVLFVFVIMLLTLREDEMGEEPPQSTKLGAAIGSIMLLFVLFFSLSTRDHVLYQMPHHQVQLEKVLKAQGDKAEITRKNRIDFGSTEHFARFLYTDYAVAFELITILVMAAVAGVIVLARRPDRLTLERTGLTAGHHTAAPGARG